MVFERDAVGISSSRPTQTRTWTSCPMAMPFMSPKHHHFHIIRYSDLLSHLVAAYCTIIYEISTNLLSYVLLLRNWKRRYNMRQWELIESEIPKYLLLARTLFASSIIPSAPSLRYILWRRDDCLRVAQDTEESYRLPIEEGAFSDAEGIFERPEVPDEPLRTSAVANEWKHNLLHCLTALRLCSFLWRIVLDAAAPLAFDDNEFHDVEVVTARHSDGLCYGHCTRTVDVDVDCATVGDHPAKSFLVVRLQFVWFGHRHGVGCSRGFQLDRGHHSCVSLTFWQGEAIDLNNLLDSTESSFPPTLTSCFITPTGSYPMTTETLEWAF